MILFIVVLLFTTKIYSQETICYQKTQFDNFNNLYVAISDYVKYNKSNTSIIIVDYYCKEGIDYFRLNYVFNTLEVLSKVPSCYFIIDSTRMVYLYTENYRYIQDTIWINGIIDKTFLTIKKNDPKLIFDVNINWNYETIFFNTFIILQALEYNPHIIEYEIVNGKINNKKFCNEMYYPNIVVSDKILKEYKKILSPN